MGVSYPRSFDLISYHAKDLESENIRPHPWERAESDESQVYVDFKTKPELIRSSLEDLANYSSYKFAIKFYSLLEWLNGKESCFESNDSAFRGVVENTTDKQFNFKYKCQGRLMFLYRDLIKNCDPDNIDCLMKDLQREISIFKPQFKAGAIGVSRMKTGYYGLGRKPKEAALGEQIMLSYFAYGKNEKRCYESMEKVIECLDLALKKVDKITKSDANS